MGNYWSDYTGSDADGDGIGDTPHMLNPYNKDNYPLMAPVGNYRSGQSGQDSGQSIPEFPSIAIPVIGLLTAVIALRKR